jgi:hypothetical protein
MQWVKCKRILEASAFGVLCIYTAFAGWQSCTISHQLEADQRAWIALQASEVTQETTNGKIGIQFTIANAGRTPAREMKWESFDELVKPKDFVTPEYAPMEDGDLYYPVSFPGNFTKSNTTFYGTKRHSAEELAKWKNQELWEELAVRVTYIDSFGKKRQTEACTYAIGAGGNTAHCRTNNYEK